jgi:hypothetical protein
MTRRAEFVQPVRCGLHRIALCTESKNLMLCRDFNNLVRHALERRA